MHLRAIVWGLGAFMATALSAQTPADTLEEVTQADPLLLSGHDLTAALTDAPAAFVYDFRAMGWPSGWSQMGLSPQQVQLVFERIPFDDLITGRPNYSMLPTALLASPRRPPVRFGAPVAVGTKLRALSTPRPLTELHYQAGTDNLQRVTALHVQEGARTLFGHSGRLQGLVAYAGAASKGEYPGSRLRRLRQWMTRTRYVHSAGSLHLLYLHNQRWLGAHGGVLGDDNVRFNRLIATVLNEGADRRHVRNDASAAWHLNRVAATATFFASSQRLRYQGRSVRARRLGASLEHSAQPGHHALQFSVTGWTHQVDSLQTAYRGRALHIQAVDSVTWQAHRLVAHGGVHLQEGQWIPSGAVAWEVTRARVHPFVKVAHTGGRGAPVAMHGWHDYVTGSTSPSSSITHALAGLGFRTGSLTVRASAFGTREVNVPNYYEIRPDSVVVHHHSARMAGASSRLGFRITSRRGVYAEVTPWVIRVLESGPIRGDALPEWGLSARAGVRYRMFSGDLDLDVSVRGQGWGAMRSRVLHAPTGLLVLPSSERAQVSASQIVDLYVQGQVRTATLYVALENLLSGTPLLTGNSIVADYPLPEQQLRFGVYWPIWN